MRVWGIQVVDVGSLLVRDARVLVETVHIDLASRDTPHSMEEEVERITGRLVVMGGDGREQEVLNCRPRLSFAPIVAG
eukprot:scaffold180741_cov48-Tisochrysis_lutea.AAC.1